MKTLGLLYNLQSHFRKGIQAGKFEDLEHADLQPVKEHLKDHASSEDIEKAHAFLVRL